MPLTNGRSRSSEHLDALNGRDRGQHGLVAAGTYVFGDFCTGEVFTLTGSTPILLRDTALNISSFGEDEFGELFVVNLNGTVHRLVAASSPTLDNFVTGLYVNVLGRTPNSGEVSAWRAFLLEHCNSAGVATTADAFFDERSSAP